MDNAPAVTPGWRDPALYQARATNPHLGYSSAGPNLALVAGPVTTPGCDLSHYNGSVDFSRMVAGGMKFFYTKATQGTNIIDQTLGTYMSAGKSAGLLRGAYHFADYRYAAKPQAQFFYDSVKNDPGELPQALDLEQLWLPLPPGSNTLAWVFDFMTAADALFGRPTLLYTNPSAIRYWLTTIPDWLKAHPLWIAHYGAITPAFQPWPKWTFWQTSGTGDGHAYGTASAGLDMDVFAGSESDLRALAGQATPPVPALTMEQKVDQMWNCFKGC